ncbi:MAG: HAD-IA family hydrolase, partial [Proteobacteria bacterium]|nr:HAD-IA family hydrolase [Pseudomonadota bacterium]
RAAVFDMDGMLLDYERPITETDYLDLVGRNHVDSRLRMLGLLGGEAGLAQAGALVDADLGARYGGTQAFDLKPGAATLVQALHDAGVPLAVASSTRRAEVERRLRNAGLLDRFGAVCGGDEVTRGKPAPDIYALAVARLGVPPGEALAFEDSGHGALAAQAAGLGVVLVPDLKPPEATWAARSVAVLASLTEAWPRCVDWFGVRVTDAGIARAEGRSTRS